MTGDPHPGPATRPLSLQIGMYWSTAEHSGGLDRIYTDLVEHLPVAGIRTLGAVEGPADVAALSGGRAAPFGAAGGGRVGRYRRMRRDLAAMLQDEPIDLVALHFALYGRLVLDRIRVPLVVHFQGPWAQEAAMEGARGPLVAVRRLIERSVYSRADRIIVLSRAFAGLLERDYGIAEERIRVVPGHVDLDRFRCAEPRAEARAALGLPNDRPLLVAVRRLKRRMGLHALLEAMATVVRAMPDVLLVLGGTGPLRAALEAQVEALGLRRNVRLLGFVAAADLPLLFRAADATVVPTEALEGFGLVAAESLAAGTPALVTAVGGLPEVVAGLSPALIFPSGDAGAMAAHLIGALKGGIVLPDAAACEAYAAGTFALPTAAQRVAGIYREVLDRR